MIRDYSGTVHCFRDEGDGYDQATVFMLDALTLTGLWPEPNGEHFGIASDEQSEFRDWNQAHRREGLADQRTHDQ
jgi:hypothetical protein